LVRVALKVLKMRLAQLEVTQFFPLLLHQVVVAVAHLAQQEMLAALAEVVVVMQLAWLVELEFQVKETQVALVALKELVVGAQALLVSVLLVTQML
jgi:hypothetical protein